LASSSIETVLDVGCGGAVLLKSVVEKFNARTGVGVEPSSAGVELLRQFHAQETRLQFEVGLAHNLSFESDSFDLVVCWSVLHWIGRNEYLQSLGELIRVTRKWLLVMDFVASCDYRVPYSHQPGFFTFKQDFVPAVLASGIMVMVDEKRWWDGHIPGGVEPIEESELTPFLENPLNYHSRRGVLFSKHHEALPVHEEADFT
jgi:SAM-dependent methyltransferase